MMMAEEKAKAKKAPKERADKDAVKATLQALAKPEKPKEKAPAVKTTSDIQVKPEVPKPVVKEPTKPEVKQAPKIEEKVKTEAPKPVVKEPAKPEVKQAPKIEEKVVKPAAKPVSEPEVPKPVVKEPAKTVPEAAAKPEAPKAEEKTELKKEADPTKEFVEAIMTEMALKGAPKKRLVKKLAEQYNLDKQRVMFKLKRALITERYAAAHEAHAAEAGH